jgi:hypothetical protein
VRRTALLSAALLTLVLAGCGSNQKASEPQVPSLPANPSASAEGDTGIGSNADDDDSASSKGRPQRRLDDTEERGRQLTGAWYDCLVKHGARWATLEDGPGVAGVGNKFPARPYPAKAQAACRNKVPLDPPELDPATNPHYRDDWKADVKCLREHGIMVHLTKDPSAGPNGLTWTYDEDAGQSPDNQEQIENDCMMRAFGNKK